MTSDERECTRCKAWLPISMFYVEAERRRSLKIGRTYTLPCRQCRREIDTANQKPRRDYSDAVKITAGCADCGIRSDHPEIYDFDHTAGEKAANIASLVTKGTWDDFVAEIAKCEVVCSNCHRIRTREREHNAWGKSRGPRFKGPTPLQEALSWGIEAAS